MLLIDEIDRADEALEAVLLETLGEYQISVPEIGTFNAKHVPYVILTSNNTSDLAAALKRRCLHLFLDYPEADRELEIVRVQGHRADRRVGRPTRRRRPGRAADRRRAARRRRRRSSRRSTARARTSASSASWAKNSARASW